MSRFLLQRDVPGARRAAATEAQISLNCHSAAPLGHSFFNFAVWGPAYVEGEVNICYSNTVMPLLQTRAYGEVKHGRVRRSMWLRWLSCAGFVGSEVSPGCVL